jgi:peptidoglycan/LPS O-acetylase OafA/YrhL
MNELFDTNRSDSAAAFGYLTGIKSLSYFGIIFIHSVSSRLFFPLRDPKEAENFLQSPMASFVEGLGYNVDTFLLISGLLTTKSMLNEMKRLKTIFTIL